MLALTALLVTFLAAGAAAPAAQAQTPPAISARNAIAVETNTGEIVYARKADERRPIASATKLMTALVALDTLEPGDVLGAARYRPLPVESKIDLRPGERMRVADLLRGLLLASANDAAVTLAEGAAGSRDAFVRRMNRRARRLGLADTRFRNPIGLDAPGAHSTARDLVRLTQAVLDVPFLARTVDRPGAVLRSGDRVRAIANRNTLVRRHPWVSGVKTGHTRGAGYVLIGSGRRSGVEVVTVVMGAPSEAAREADTLALLRHGLRQFRRATAVRSGRVLGTAAIQYRRGAEAELVAGRTVRRVVRRGTRFRVRVTDAPAEVTGPLPAGRRVGTAQVLQDGRPVADIPLVLGIDVPAATLGQRFREYFSRPLTLVLLVALAVCGLQFAVLARRRARRSDRRRPRREVEPA